MTNFLKQKKSAFTLIELLVVIAIIGILSTLAVVALQNARSKARDSKRVADVKQIQTALELYFNDNGSYPTSITSTIATSGIVYMASMPTAPTPVDGSCDDATNAYTYTSDGSTYSIAFCLGGGIANLSSGQKVATRDGISNPPPPPPFDCGTTLTDSRDSQQYPTVQIGTQCWMAKNLNYQGGCSSNTWVNGSDTGWCGCYFNTPAFCDIYGTLYQWSAAMNGSVTERARGACPTGWHLPSSSEINTLISYLGGDVWYIGGYLKQEGTSYWESPNTGATNSSGFDGLPSGLRTFSNGSFNDVGWYSYFWESTLSGSDAVFFNMAYDHEVLSHSNFSPAHGAAVRCLND